MTNLTTNLIALITLITFTLISINANAQLHVVKPDGDVGIGTDTPTQKLDVDGNVNVRGGLFNIGSNDNGVSRLIVGANKTKENIAYIDLHPGASRAGRLISRVSNGIASTSFHNYGEGNFSTRVWGQNSSIGFTTYTGTALIINPQGNIGIGTADPQYKLHVNGTAAKTGNDGWVVLSDKRTKKNVNTFRLGLKEIMKINPVTFKYNGKAGVVDTEKEHVGLIAQEFAEIVPNAVGKYVHTDTVSLKNEEYMTIDASSVRYMLVNAVKELQATIELQRAEIVDLKESVAKINTAGAATTNPAANEINVLLEGNGAASALLAQNMPNPFTTTTRIEYFIPANSRNARMSFRDMTGKEIKRVDIIEEGVGAIELTARDLASGIYSYVLYTNGNIVDSKKMIVK